MRREGEAGRKRQRVGGCFPSCPDSSSAGPQRRAATESGGQDPGTLHFRFPPTCSVPLPLIWKSLAVPRPPPARPGLSQDPSSGSFTPPRPQPGSPTPRQVPSPPAGARVPGAGLGRRRGCAGRPQAGAWDVEGRGVPWAAPGFFGLKTWGNRVPTVSLPPTPRRGTHLQRPSRPGGQEDQCQSGQHRDPARGTECAAVGVGSAAPWLCRCRRRRRLRWPRARAAPPALSCRCRGN